MVDMSYNIVDCYFEDNKMILSDTKRNNFIEFLFIVNAYKIVPSTHFLIISECS